MKSITVNYEMIEDSVRMAHSNNSDKAAIPIPGEKIGAECIELIITNIARDNPVSTDELQNDYKQAAQRYKSDPAFREKSHQMVSVLHGNALDNPSIVEKLKIIRAATIADMLTQYWSLNIKIPVSSFVGKDVFPGLPPLELSEIICAIVALKKMGA